MRALLLVLPLLAATASHARDLNEATYQTPGPTQLTAEIWVDNWFAMHLNGQALHEDSTAYRTERSFNAERVTFNTTLPATLAFEFRDFMEDDTGLEYIGTRRQQMGDGGAIVQIKDGAGAVVAVSATDWACTVIHQAPAQTSCADEADPQVGEGACAASITSAPDGWTAPGFDDSAWTATTAHSESAVRPKDGFDAISWDASAQLIWSDDLVRDNIVLCRMTLSE